MSKTGLVFAGGGVKGSYQVGVWKALLEMGIQVDCVVGTSIGSVNGALFAQGELDTAQKLWETITIGDIIRLENSTVTDVFEIKSLLELTGEIKKNWGLDITPFRELLCEVIDEEKIRNSPIEYGLTTFSLNEFKELELFKEDIPQGMLIDYLLAGSCLPVFQSKKVENKLLLDGGMGNNIPADMLLARGADTLIVVDVGGVGITKPVDTTGINVFSIRCSEKIVGVLEFNQENILKNMKAGYYDCFRAFGRLCGETYYFNVGDYHKKRQKYSKKMMQQIETAADVFGIERLAVYEIDRLIGGILKAYEAAKQAYQRMKQDLSVETVLKGNLKLDEKTLTVWLVGLFEEKNPDVLGGKLAKGMLSRPYQAASAVLYLKNQ
jgi:NTE family protein